VPWDDQLPAFQCRGLGFKPRSVHAEFVVGKVEVVLEFLRVVFPRECHSISAPYLFIHHKAI
jgi:hypothetical protein